MSLSRVESVAVNSPSPDAVPTAKLILAIPLSLVRAVPVSFPKTANSSLLSVKVTIKSSCGSPSLFNTVATAVKLFSEDKSLSDSPAAFCNANDTVVAGSTVALPTAEKVVEPDSPLLKLPVISPSPEAVLALMVILATPLTSVRAVPVSFPNTARSVLLNANVTSWSAWATPSVSVTVAITVRELSAVRLRSVSPLAF